MTKAQSSSAYKGTVTIKVKNKNRIKKTLKGKNTGAPMLFRTIALALAGYTVGNNVPTYMALTTATDVSVSISSYTITVTNPPSYYNISAEGTIQMDSENSFGVGDVVVSEIKVGDAVQTGWRQIGDTITLGSSVSSQTTFAVKGLITGKYNKSSYSVGSLSVDEDGIKGSGPPDYSQCSLPVSVTGRSYGQDNNGDWFCRVTATIPKSNFRNTWATGASFYAVLLNGRQESTISELTNVLAYIELMQKETGEKIDLTQMQEGSSLIIEWNLYVQNYEVVKQRVEG